MYSEDSSNELRSGYATNTLANRVNQRITEIKVINEMIRVTSIRFKVMFGRDFTIATLGDDTYLYVTSKRLRNVAKAYKTAIQRNRRGV